MLKKVTRIILEIIASVVLTIIVLPLTLSIIIQVDFFQQIIVQEFSKAASKKLGVAVSIDNLAFKIFNEVSVTGFFVADPFDSADTLLYAQNASATLSSIDLSTGKIFLDNAAVDGGVLKIVSDSSAMTNIKVVVEKLKNNKPKKRVFSMLIDDLKLDNFAFGYRKEPATLFRPEGAINYQDLRFNSIKARGGDFNIYGSEISAFIDSLAFTEKSGFELHNISSDTVFVSPDLISLKNIKCRVENSAMNLNYLTMSYDNWQMGNFIEDVVLDVSVSQSDINFSTIEKFGGTSHGWKLPLKFIGSAKGTIDNMSGIILLAECYKSRITNTQFSIKGLPNIASTHFSSSIGYGEVNGRDILRIASDFSGKVIPVNPILERLGNVVIDGEFKGSLNDFKSSGNLTTLLGKVDFKLDKSLKNKISTLSGSAATKGFNLALLLNNNKLGNIAFQAAGTTTIGGVPYLDATCDLFNADFNGYNYKNIELVASQNDNEYYGFAQFRDPNLKGVFTGFANIIDSTPYFGADLNIREANLYKLNFNKRDTISQLSTKITVNGTGSSLDDINGLVVIDNMNYISALDTLKGANVRFNGVNTPYKKEFSFESKYFNLNLSSKQSFNYLIPYLKRTASLYLPTLSKSKTLAVDNSVLESKLSDSDTLDSNYSVDLLVKKGERLSAILLPNLEVADSTYLKATFNPVSDRIWLHLNSKHIALGENIIDDVNFYSRNYSDSLQYMCTIGQATFGSIFMPNVVVSGNAANDNIATSLRFYNDNDGSAAMLKSDIGFSKNIDEKIVTSIAVDSSYINIKDSKWILKPSVTTMSGGVTNIDNFIAECRNQKLAVNGSINSREKNGEVTISLEEMELAGFSEFIKGIGYNISGGMSGDATYRMSNGNSSLLADLDITQLMLNDYRLPDITIRGGKSYDGSENVQYQIRADNEVIVDGTVNLKSGKYLASVEIDSLDCTPFTPLMKAIGSDVSGKASIDVVLDNNKRPLNINGAVELHNFETTIDFTKVHYAMSGRVDIKDNVYTLNKGIVIDPRGTAAPIRASLNGGDRYSRVKYDIAIDAKEMVCLQTTPKDNPLFYGDVKGTGNIVIDAKGTDVTMNINADIVDNSKFYMPLSDKTSIGEADFIKFKSAEVKTEEKRSDFINLSKKKKNSSASQFALNMVVGVDNTTEVQLVIDPTVGDIMKARGVGEFRMQIIPTRDLFTLNGSYEITSGDYLFTLPNFELINKYFVIKPGSSVTWSGDPLAANLNITATYQTKTSLAPLLGDLPEYTRRVEVDCDLNLSGQLLKPDITLGIALPGADPETQSVIATALNTEEAISKQIFWLLFSNSFYADAATSGTNVTVGMMESAGTVAGIEFLSNQISNWISSDKFDLGINYRPKSDLSSDEVELNVSAPLLNNRLILEAEGNYDFQNNNTYLTDNSNALSGNFYVTYILDQMGHLRLKGFTRQIDTFDENQGLQESGVGVYYTEEFDNLADLLLIRRKNRAEGREARSLRASNRMARKSEKEDDSKEKK